MGDGHLRARLAVALALSAAAHALLAWQLGRPGNAAAAADPRGLVVLRAAAPEPGPVAQLAPARGSRAPHYWPVAALDVRPQIRTQVMPEYPSELPSGVNGRVVLELFLSPQGTIDRVNVLRAEPPGRFEQSAVKAFSAARYTAGMRKGKAVHSRLRIEVTYGD